MSSNQTVVACWGELSTRTARTVECSAMKSFNTSTPEEQERLLNLDKSVASNNTNNLSSVVRTLFSVCPEKFYFLKSILCLLFFLSMAVPDNNACCHFAKCFLFNTVQLLPFEY